MIKSVKIVVYQQKKIMLKIKKQIPICFKSKVIINNDHVQKVIIYFVNNDELNIKRK